jgi:hypothetical protein
VYARAAVCALCVQKGPDGFESDAALAPTGRSDAAAVDAMKLEREIIMANLSEVYGAQGDVRSWR